MAHCLAVDESLRQLEYYIGSIPRGHLEFAAKQCRLSRWAFFSSKTLLFFVEDGEETLPALNRPLTRDIGSAGAAQQVDGS